MSVKKLKQLQKLEPWQWYEDAEEIICNAILDNTLKENDRVAAIEMAAESVVMNDRVASTLLQVMENNDESEELRRHIPITLGAPLEYAEMMEFDDPDDILLSEKMFKETKERLRKFFQNLENPEEVRRYVLEGAVRAPMEWHRKAIKDAYYSGNENWRVTAVFAMAYIEGFEKEILETMEAENPHLRLQAVWAAGHQGIHEAWPYFVEILTADEGEVNEDILVTAIQVAHLINAREALELLQPFQLSEDEELAEIAEEAAHEALLYLQEDDFDEEFEEDDEDMDIYGEDED